MKKLIFVLILGILITGLIGCSDDVDGVSKSSNRFVDTKDKYSICRNLYEVVYDKKTNIVYIISKANGGFTVMYNKEGKPMKIDEYNNSK